ncbi:hypothetical protein P6709_09325 [Jeotgalibacillus sp. ET6]|uniref:hypothetical protein n=1 Tax=Jeotgalibacillus sp. ET6 TaxID=3037260 RepID=UPI002418A1CB|nr:hypothetical protein [Jeotgalibacillus sp. ET6]MDG5471949.1 hypothetical protein [Jeotgalibacillus sp. ET6]
MKNNSTVMTIINILAILCVGWLATAFYKGNESFADFIWNQTEEFSVEIPLVPFIAIGLLGAMSYILMKKLSKRKKTFKSFFLPPEFSEQDERERAITARACRNSYIFLTYFVPLIVLVLAFEPVYERIFPSLSIWIVLLIPLVQYLSYYFTIRRQES